VSYNLDLEVSSKDDMLPWDIRYLAVP